MTNYYQYALDYIKEHSNTTINKGDGWELSKNYIPNEYLDVLQELIDNYGELLEKFNEQSKSYGNCCIEREQYKKALDKACKELVDEEYSFINDATENWTEKQWKEWLLKDE